MIFIRRTSNYDYALFLVPDRTPSLPRDDI